MQEQVLAKFFAGSLSATALRRDLRKSLIKHDCGRSLVRIEDMDEDFEVRRPMLVRLCDAVIDGQIPPEDLAVVGFALLASDKFSWDADEDELMVEVINDWSSPEINYPLTLESVGRFRKWLLNEEPYPPKVSLPEREGTVVSVREKVFIGRWKKPFRYFLENLF